MFIITCSNIYFFNNFVNCFIIDNHNLFILFGSPTAFKQLNEKYFVLIFLLFII